MKKNKSIIQPATLRNTFVALLLTFLVSCGGKEEKKEEAEAHEEDTEVMEVTLTKDQADAAGIETIVLEEKNLSGILKASGKMDVPPQNLVTISAPLTGFLKATEMLEGKHVKKGEVIAVIEHPDIVQLQQDFVEAKFRFEFLELELARQKELSLENVNSKKILQQAQSDFSVAQVKFRALEERLKMAGINIQSVLKGNLSGTIVITSPLNGYVTKVNVNIGKLVSQQDVMFEIVDTEHLHAELVIFEKDISKIKEGQKVRFSLANDPGNELTAHVYLIGRSFDETRSVRIHCHLDKEDKELLPGMFINAVIELDSTNVKAVPADAIVRSDGKEFVFIKEAKTGCGKHTNCSDHLAYCSPDENCPEHPECEAHEKCKDGANCKEHKECAEHENCKGTKEVTGYTFVKKEVRSGITDGRFVEIKLVTEIEEGSEVVNKGAFFILSQSKMGGQMDACGH